MNKVFVNEKHYFQWKHLLYSKVVYVSWL